MKAFEKENPSCNRTHGREFLYKKNQASNSSKPWVKFKNFSDYVSNIDQKGEGMGVDKRRFLLKTSSFLFPYAVFMIMGFRAFFFLYFIKYRIYSHNSPQAPLLDISRQRRRGGGKGSYEPLGAGSPPPWQTSSCSDIFLRPSDSPGVTQSSAANLNQFFQDFPFLCEISLWCVKEKLLREEPCVPVCW